jgi:hypothetical protein
LVSSHAHTLISVSNINGVNYYVVRNPWGTSGDPLENGQGYATFHLAGKQVPRPIGNHVKKRAGCGDGTHRRTRLALGM